MPVEAAAGERRYGEPLTGVVLANHGVLMYPECPRYDPSRELMVGGDERMFTVEQLKESPALVQPFPTATYFCQLLPPALFADLLRLFPPESLFENTAERAASCTRTDCRYSLSAFSLVKLSADEATAAWPLFPEGVKARSFRACAGSHSVT